MHISTCLGEGCSQAVQGTKKTYLSILVRTTINKDNASKLTLKDCFYFRGFCIHVHPIIKQEVFHCLAPCMILETARYQMNVWYFTFLPSVEECDWSHVYDRQFLFKMDLHRHKPRVWWRSVMEEHPSASCVTVWMLQFHCHCVFICKIVFFCRVFYCSKCLQTLVNKCFKRGKKNPKIFACDFCMSAVKTVSRMF